MRGLAQESLFWTCCLLFNSICRIPQKLSSEEVAGTLAVTLGAWKKASCPSLWLEKLVSFSLSLLKRQSICWWHYFLACDSNHLGAELSSLPHHSFLPLFLLFFPFFEHPFLFFDEENAFSCVIKMSLLSLKMPTLTRLCKELITIQSSVKTT